MGAAQKNTIDLISLDINSSRLPDDYYIGGANLLNEKPVADETLSTSTGKRVHKEQADIRRESGQFSIVEQPIADKLGNPIFVPKRVSLRTGEALPGTPLQKAIPDAVNFDRKLYSG